MIKLFFALKIDTIPDWLSGYPILAIPRFNDDEIFFDDENLFFDVRRPILNNRQYVTEEGSSQSISQSINPDKDGSSSTTSITFRIVDFKKYFKKWLSNRGLGDLLGKEAKVFAVKNTDSFPEESKPVLFGYVEDISLESGTVTITVYSVLNYLRSNILPKWSSSLTTNFEYESLTLDGNRYFARSLGVYDIFVEYVIGSSPISVSVTSPTPIQRKITVTFPNGTLAKDVRKAISDNADADRLVEVKSLDDSVVQVARPPTILGKTKFVNVEDSSGLVLGNSDQTFETFININDEILKVLSNNTTTNVVEIDEITRGRFKSFSGVTASEGDSVDSFYVLRGDPITIFLKLALSNQSNRPIPVTGYGFIAGVGPVPNAIECSTDDVYRDYGIVVGDKCSMGSVFANRTVLSIKKSKNLKSYIIVDGPDIGYDASYVGSLTFTSQFSTLPIGAGVPSYLVDVQRFIDIRANIFAELPDLEFYIKSDLNLKEFSEKDLFFPSQLFLCPRNGKISLSSIRPMSDSAEAPVIDSSMFIEPERIVVNRSLNEYYYNTISYYYDKDSIDDDFKSVRHDIDIDSVTIYRKNIVPLVIEASGLRSTPANSVFLRKKPLLILDRYKYGAIYFDLVLTLKDGLKFEIGDVVLFNGSDIYFPSFEDPDYTLGAGFYQIINREVGETSVRVRLVATQFRSSQRYVTFAPSSKIIAQPDPDKLTISPSFSYSGFETGKWERYKSQSLIISNLARSFTIQCTLEEVEPPDTLILKTPITNIPSFPAYIFPADYSGPAGFNRLIKAAHGSFAKKSQIISVISSNTFQVPSGDGLFFYENLDLIIHDAAWSFSETVRVASVSGDIVTISGTLSNPLSVGLLIDLRGFYTDKGAVYVWS